MTSLVFALSNGAVLSVARPRGEWATSSTLVSFYASSGELPPGLRDELDAGLPLETAEPDSVLARVVTGILGDRLVDRPTATVAPARGESEMEALQRALEHDRDTGS
jgi:hypothetical protein